MIRFLIPEPKDRRSGGTLYDLQMVDTLIERGNAIKIDWVGENNGIKKLFPDINKNDLLIIDGLVFHQNYNDVHLIDHYKRIYLTHLPFWLEPGIPDNESEIRKKHEVEFMKMCRLIVCTSGFIKNEILKWGITEDKILIINPLIKERSLIKRNYSKTPTALLVVGSVHFGKGLDILIKTLAQMKNKKWNLKIAGNFNPGDAYYKALCVTIKKSGLISKIQFLGECNAEQIEKLYFESDLLIHPSRFESYGMAVGEALNYKLPVIASDAGALRDVFGSSPVRFFNSENPSSLADVLRLALNPNEYLEWVMELEKTIFKVPGKVKYDDKINKLITHLQ
jgi:glycosyltransferase involved in cell wall biosynthesis